MSTAAQHTPGPWMVCAKTARQFTVWRYAPGPSGTSGIEYIRNTNGNTKHFRSEESAYAAIRRQLLQIAHAMQPKGTP